MHTKRKPVRYHCEAVGQRGEVGVGCDGEAIDAKRRGKGAGRGEAEGKAEKRSLYVTGKRQRKTNRLLWSSADRQIPEKNVFHGGVEPNPLFSWLSETRPCELGGRMLHKNSFPRQPPPRFLPPSPHISPLNIFPASFSREQSPVQVCSRS